VHDSFSSARTHAPGLLVCGAVALGALALERLEVRLAGHAWVEALVLAILAGTAVRTLWTPPARFACGIQWAAKGLLECAVALMGVTISFATIAAAGLPLLAGIVAIVFGAIAASFLPRVRTAAQDGGARRRGNAICGNSAIAAVAPVIDAESDDVATAIAFTAVLGVAVVIALPIVAHALHPSAAAPGNAGRPDRLCRAAGAGRRRPARPLRRADRHPGQAGARADAGTGRRLPVGAQGASGRRSGSRHGPDSGAPPWPAAFPAAVHPRVPGAGGAPFAGPRPRR
jgi:hypothetical protein